MRVLGLEPKLKAPIANANASVLPTNLSQNTTN